MASVQSSNPLTPDLSSMPTPQIEVPPPMPAPGSGWGHNAVPEPDKKRTLLMKIKRRKKRRKGEINGPFSLLFSVLPTCRRTSVSVSSSSANGWNPASLIIRGIIQSKLICFLTGKMCTVPVPTYPSADLPLRVPYRVHHLNFSHIFVIQFSHHFWPHFAVPIALPAPSTRRSVVHPRRRLL